MNKRGIILTEVCLGVFITTITLLIAGILFKSLLGGGQKIAIDLAMYRTERSAFLHMRREIGWQAKRVCIINNGKACTLKCYELGEKRTVSYYTGLSGNNLYRSIKVIGQNEGINPLLDPEFMVSRWKISKLNEKALVVEIGIKHKKSNRERVFIEVIKVCNGKIE
ncbi:MAG TPA: hypothetical protein IAB06_05750 [Candidatus Avacidaminococcus intestinavium]|uniref:Uncharacterized protein n=1 Tax=Candidatus Avacidaminococcus intestinavium TaxID=2840684 RepID=A0A9D1MQF3_9FIRM|nr:hypothetical protein [Candidatus Avacidaminococcus intestinavium]